MERQTFTIPEFCRLLGVGKNIGYEAARKGTLPVPVIQIGKRLVIPRRAAERLLNGGDDSTTVSKALKP